MTYIYKLFRWLLPMIIGAVVLIQTVDKLLIESLETEISIEDNMPDEDPKDVDQDLDDFVFAFFVNGVTDQSCEYLRVEYHEFKFDSPYISLPKIPPCI